MELVTIILLIGVVLRVLLDLTSLNRSSYIFDALYVVLFGVVAIVLLSADLRDVFGYACIAIAVVWGLFGFYKYKRRINA